MPHPITNFPYREAAKYLLDGRLIVFLGAGASLNSRSASIPANSLPSGGELARDLVTALNDPVGNNHLQDGDLCQVSQYCATVQSEMWLYTQLRPIFTDRYLPTSLHESVASVVSRQLKNGRAPKAPLVITTNYDLIMEHALASYQASHAIAYDTLVYHQLDGRGIFHLYRSDHPEPDKAEIIENPDSFDGIAVTGARLSYLDRRPVLLKIHGSSHLSDPLMDSYVISQDDYIRYLIHMNVSRFLPSQIAGVLPQHPCLFVGYGLRDWNINALLAYFWGQRSKTMTSYAVQWQPSPVDDCLWEEKDVSLYDASSDPNHDFGAELWNELEGLAPL